MWDKKPHDDIIWKLIKPKWSKPFRKDLDNWKTFRIFV
jgi:hypothetical protein